MKEFSFAVKDSFTKGLRKTSTNPINKGGLIQCQNATPKTYGDVRVLEAYSPLSLTISIQDLVDLYGIGATFPFPQLFRGRETSFVLNNDDLYTANESDWTLTQETTYDPYNTGSTKAITADGIWQFMDFGYAYAFFNGTDIVFKSNERGMFGGADKAYVNSDIGIRTGCKFKGRAILGGFSSSSGGFNDHWKNWINEMEDANELGLSISSLSRFLGTNYVWWSSIGGGDVFSLIFPELMEEGLVTRPGYTAYSHAQALLYDSIMKNQMGWIPMPWQGDINVVKKLGDVVMVYGDGGIAALVPGNGTFGIKMISKVGVSDRGAVGGDEEQHTYVDDASILYQITPDLRTKRLDYGEFMGNLGNMVIVNNEARNEVYLSDSSRSYTLTDTGMGESTYLVTSCEGVVSGNPTGFYLRPGTGTDAYMIIVTDKFDMGNRGQKIIEGVTVESEDTQGIQVAIDWKVSRAGSFSTTGYKVINYEGDVRFPISGVEFRIRIRSTDYTNSTPPTRIRIHWKNNDRRLVRSAHDFETIP